MSKLFRLKSWFTLKETSVYLSQAFGESVQESDVLRLALDYKLKLSVIFVDGVWAELLKPVDEDSISYNEVPTLSGEGTIRLPIGGQIFYSPRGELLQAQNSIFPLDSDEPYDLMMLGGEHADVLQMYWSLSSTEVEETTNLDGTFVSQGAGSSIRYFQLQDKLKGGGFYPIGKLPNNAPFVVSRAAIVALEKSLEQQPLAATAGEPDENPDSPLGTKERNTLLTLIGLIADLAKLDIAAPSKAASVLGSAADLRGVKLSPRSIEEHLKRVPNAMLSKSK